MQVGIRTVAVTALVALLVPVAAVAEDARAKGPSALVDSDAPKPARETDEIPSLEDLAGMLASLDS